MYPSGRRGNREENPADQKNVENKMMKISKKFTNILKVLITVALIILLIKRVNLKESLMIFLQIEPFFLFLGAFFYLSILLIATYRRQCLLKIQNIYSPLGKLIRLTFIGHFFNHFLPTTIGGDVVKGYLLARETKKNHRNIHIYFD